MPEEEIIEAVADLRHHDQHAGLVIGGEELEGHGVGGGDRLEGLAEGFEGGGTGVAGAGCVGAEVHAHEEGVGGRVAVLRGVDDVQVVLDQEVGDGADDPGPVGAGEGEDEAHVERIGLC